jgi:hypothetical protein
LVKVSKSNISPASYRFVMIKNAILILVITLWAMSSVAWSQNSQGTLALPTESETPLPEGRVILTTEGSAADFTPAQREFLQATMDDLSKIGNKRTAVNLNYYIRSGHATFGEENSGTLASTKSPPLGALDRISMNNLNINQNTVTGWESFREVAAKAKENGFVDTEKANLHEGKKTIRDLAFTLVHEDVHMHQTTPMEFPSWENPAYETAISEMRRVIKDDMQQILDTEFSSERDKINELIEDLEISKEVYKEKIDSMQNDAISKGKVDPEEFKTTKADMDELTGEADKLIKEKRDFIKSYDTKEGSNGDLGGTEAPGASMGPEEIWHTWAVTDEGKKFMELDLKFKRSIADNSLNISSPLLRSCSGTPSGNHFSCEWINDPTSPNSGEPTESSVEIDFSPDGKSFTGKLKITQTEHSGDRVRKTPSWFTWEGERIS